MSTTIHFCISCGDSIPSWDTAIGACDHGLLCNGCRYENQCLACKRERGEPEPEQLQHTPLEGSNSCSASCPVCRQLRLSGLPDNTPKWKRIRGTRAQDPDDFRDNYFTRG